MLPIERLAARVEEITAAVTARSQLSVTAAKEIIDDRADQERIAWWHRQVRDSGEAREGVGAFNDRRPPRFGWTPPAQR